MYVHINYRRQRLRVTFKMSSTKFKALLDVVMHKHFCTSLMKQFENKFLVKVVHCTTYNVKKYRSRIALEIL